MLRPYQQNIKHNLFEAWRQCPSVMVQMPTGTGKTHLLASVISDRMMADDTAIIWIVAHRRELVEQIEETVARYGISKDDGRVKVMSIQWLSKHWENVRDERPGLIVIDEAHHALAGTYRDLWLRYPDAKKLGMTATPCRLNGKGFTDLFDTLITSDSIADFIRQGWLSAFDYVSIRPDSEDQRLINGLERRGADGDFQVKEMDTVLNRRPSIERLYGSVRQYADGKKGIVYAISISHARNISGYYNQCGMNTVAIDSKTPANERKRLVESFRQGKIQVLVNVDIFSEGFDCPDVEFIQLARPTLSLPKYLQQVGRGLRKTEGKESCMIIDNVGLYRLFGLPTAHWDWQAMFEGRLAGKGYPDTNMRAVSYMAVSQETDKDKTAETDGQLETIVSHGQLLDYLQSGKSLPENDSLQPEKLRPFKDRASGLYGLKRGNKITSTARYHSVLDTAEGLATVCFDNGQAGVVDESGNVRMRLGRCRSAKFMKGKILALTGNSGRKTYMDLLSGQICDKQPRIRQFGPVQMLEADGMYYSRTKELYKTRKVSGCHIFHATSFCLLVYDYYAAPVCRQVNEDDARWGHDCVCLLANDNDTYYRYCGMLSGGSIVIVDNAGKYYIVEEGRGKKYIACENPKTVDEDFDVVIPHLKVEAARRTDMMVAEERQTNERKRMARLEMMKTAVPFKSGMRWGLRQGEKVVVPPVYRSIQYPVGYYCAVEVSPCRWGIIMLDGKVVVEANYSKVVINGDGTARLTVFPGKEKVVELGT
ncbi:MAG TPA: helicase [Paraprevotella xylaniphila]|uniref:DEAD/DEAH box helicase n=1 Tax=Paraprevotella xylaniphila TaxID=454155 RepID=UPI000EDE292D|nr:helicase [Paraprevotella xylaniphila]